jgi:FkbM family methyltransferase
MLERLFGTRLQDLGVCWVEAANGVGWKLDLRDVTQRWIVYGDYEGSRQMSWIRRWLAEGGVVIDSGANIGQMVLYVGPMTGVEIHAFEPLDTAYEWLRECVECYPDWRVKMLPFGLSDVVEALPLQVAGAQSTTRLDWYQGKTLQQKRASFVTLDGYLRAEGIRRVRLWKLDVEGAELKALKGAEGALREHAIEAVLVEVTQYQPVRAFLDLCGYRLCRLDGSGGLVSADGAGTAGGNLVAVPRRGAP